MLSLLASILPLCLIPIQETPVEIYNFYVCVQQEKKIEHVIEWEPLVTEYFKQEDIPEALLIIYCESSGRPKAVGQNRNGTRDIGLFQFNDDTWAWLSQKLNIKNSRYDARTNVRYAAWLYYNDGNHHWNSSSKCWRTNDRTK
jgi:hypothetical protein